MTKTILKKAAEGFLPGITIGYLITVIISLLFAEGNYNPVVPTFQAWAGSEINAVLIQTLLTGVIGSIFFAATVIWEYEKWSLLKRTLLYYTITLIPLITITLFLHWVEFAPLALLSYIIIFTIIFFIIWTSTYLKIKKEIDEINRQLKK